MVFGEKNIIYILIWFHLLVYSLMEWSKNWFIILLSKKNYNIQHFLELQFITCKLIITAISRQYSCGRDTYLTFIAFLDKWIELIFFSVISNVFIVKMYNLLFLGTEETVDLDTI